MGLDAALGRFQLTLACLQQPEDVARVAREICEDAAEDAVSTLEIRFAPQLHHGGSQEDLIDAALEGIDGRAGLLLCGLYGENPDVLHGLVEIARSRPGVVGIDLAGGPIPGARFSLTDYASPFERARELGLGRTVHAAEGRSPSEIRIAILALHAQRIGHGTTLLDDPEVLDLVLRSEVTIEACPTSNVHTGVINHVADHPLPRWLQLGVRACINTDNTLLSDVCASEEHSRAADIPGMDATSVQAAIAWGHAATFPMR
jgi:adenosine deaminase